MYVPKTGPAPSAPWGLEGMSIPLAAPVGASVAKASVAPVSEPPTAAPVPLAAPVKETKRHAPAPPPEEEEIVDLPEEAALFEDEPEPAPKKRGRRMLDEELDEEELE